MDMSTTFRRLSHFNPSGTASSPTYLADFSAELIKSTTTGLKEDDRRKAEGDLAKWLDVYSRRIKGDEEVAAWGGAEGWEEKRKGEMLSVNPRFVLRQWVLEELIADLEKLGVEGIVEGRKALSRVLEVSCACQLDLYDG
jgi:uncharacterized protein YdiU (UPF0061 family)